MHFYQPPTYIDLAPAFEPNDGSGLRQAGFDGLLFSDLYDLVMMFGFVGYEEDTRVIEFPYPSPLTIEAKAYNAETGQVFLCIGPFEDASIIFSFPAGQGVLHDDVRLSELCAGMRYVDQRMVDCGFMDPRTGIRAGIYDPKATGKLRVDDVFRRPESLLRPPPKSGVAFNIFMDRFDQPRRIAPIELSSGYYICLADEHDTILKKDLIRRRVIAEYYKRYNVTDERSFRRLSQKRARKLNRRIEETVKRELRALPK
jgi:hypothetical protein